MPSWICLAPFTKGTCGWQAQHETASASSGDQAAAGIGANFRVNHQSFWIGFLQSFTVHEMVDQQAPPPNTGIFGGRECASLEWDGLWLGVLTAAPLQEEQHPRGIAWATLYWTVHLEEDKATRQYLYNVTSIFPKVKPANTLGWSPWGFLRDVPPVHACTLAGKFGKVWGARQTAVLSSITVGLWTDAQFGSVLQLSQRSILWVS